MYWFFLCILPFFPLSSQGVIEIYSQGFSSTDSIPYSKESFQQEFSKLSTDQKLQLILEELGYTIRHLSSQFHAADKVLFYNHPTSLHNPSFNKIPRSKRILVLWEPPTIMPNQYSPAVLSQYDTILTYRDDLVDGRKFHKFLWSRLKPMSQNLPPFEKKKLVCTVVGNKASSGQGELYSKRREIIRFYESNFPHLFDFYGRGWDGKGFKTYQGAPQNKLEVMKHYKFAYCLENMSHISGWITEKIFDSFAAGSIPIYLGANDIDKYIPSDCFIDMRKFNTLETLHQYIASISEEEHAGYVKRINRFLHSDKAKLFSDQHFLKTILSHLIKKEELDAIDWEKLFSYEEYLS